MPLMIGYIVKSILISKNGIKDFQKFLLRANIVQKFVTPDVYLCVCLSAGLHKKTAGRFG